MPTSGSFAKKERQKLKRIDLTGQRFGRLMVVRYAGRSRGKKNLWLCKCDCGNEKVVAVDKLHSGNTKSCGCLQREVHRKCRMTHGKSDTKLYLVWREMITRTENQNAERYGIYGGRGISICGEWHNDFQLFYDWAIQNGYKEGLTIDRIDVNGNYEPDNCRWITPYEQSRNLRKNVRITYSGKTMILKDWAKEIGIDYHTLWQRIRKSGWTVEEAFETPVGEQRKK